MFGILVDAAILIVLLKTMVDEDVGLWSAGGLALGTSIVTGILAFVFAIGIFAMTDSETTAFVVGLVLAGIVASGMLGVAISALYGAGLKQACILGGVFVVIHIGVGLALHFML